MSPSSWDRVKFGSLVDIKTGKLNSNAAKPNGHYPFFTCSRETYRTNTFSFDTEAVLLAGNNANGIYPIKYYKGKFDAYQRTYVLQTKMSNRLINRFLYYLLQPQLEMLQTLSTGAATKFLTLTILNSLDLVLPPLPIQRRIASILSAYDDLIENNTRRIEILEEMARRLYEEWFVRFRFPGHEDVAFRETELGRVPEGWEVKPLYDLAEVTYGYPFKSKQFNEDGIGLGVIRIRDIKGNLIKTYTQEEGKLKHKIVNGDILVGMDGAFHMGKWAGGEAWLNQRVLRMRPLGDMTRYLLFLSTEKPIKTLEGTIVGTTVAHLSAQDMKSMQIIQPSKAILQTASYILEPMFDLELKLWRKNANLRAQRDLLLPKLISGQIDVSQAEEMTEEAVA